MEDGGAEGRGTTRAVYEQRKRKNGGSYEKALSGRGEEEGQSPGDDRRRRSLPGESNRGGCLSGRKKVQRNVNTEAGAPT